MLLWQGCGMLSKLEVFITVRGNTILLSRQSSGTFYQQAPKYKLSYDSSGRRVYKRLEIRSRLAIILTTTDKRFRLENNIG